MLDLFCAKNRLRKHQIFEKWETETILKIGNHAIMQGL